METKEAISNNNETNTQILNADTDNTENESELIKMKAQRLLMEIETGLKFVKTLRQGQELLSCLLVKEVK